MTLDNVGAIASIIASIVAVWVKCDMIKLRNEINQNSPNRNKITQDASGDGNQQAGGNIGG